MLTQAAMNAAAAAALYQEPTIRAKTTKAHEYDVVTALNTIQQLETYCVCVRYLLDIAC